MSRRDPNRPQGAASRGPASDASVAKQAIDMADSDTWRDELALAVRETCRRWTKLVKNADEPLDTLELGALVQAAVDGAKRLTTYEGAVVRERPLALVTPIRKSALAAGEPKP